MTNLAEWRSCGVVLGWPGPPAALSSHGFVEGGGSSFIQLEKCLSGMLRCKQQLSDHQVGMRGRVVCHQSSNDGKSYVSESQILLMSCRWKREVVQALSPEAPQ